MSTPDDATVERVARWLCEWWGHDPDFVRVVGPIKDGRTFYESVSDHGILMLGEGELPWMKFKVAALDIIALVQEGETTSDRGGESLR